MTVVSVVDNQSFYHGPFAELDQVPAEFASFLAMHKKPEMHMFILEL
jgi:hypothetical protein